MDQEKLTLSILIRKHFTFLNSRGMILHEFIECPNDNLKYSQAGLRRGCTICWINKLLMGEDEQV